MYVVGPWVASLSSQPSSGHICLHSHKFGALSGGWKVAMSPCPQPLPRAPESVLAELLQIPLDAAAQANLNATGTRLLIPLHTLSHGASTASSARSHVRHQGSQ